MSQNKGNATKNINRNIKKNNGNSCNNIGFKKYLYAFLILIGGILFTLYMFEWYQVKREEKLMTSYLITSNTIQSSIEDLDSLNQIRQEAPTDYFMYISYTGNEEVYNLEKELKRVIDKYKLNDIFYYVDLTDLKNNNENYLNDVKNKLQIKELDKLPVIIYVSEGKILNSNILDGINKTMLKAEDLEQLLEIYEFEAVK